MPALPSPYFPERFFALRPRFTQLQARFGSQDFDNYAEPTWELRDALRADVAAWQQHYDAPAELLAREPPRSMGAGGPGRVWQAWSKQVREYAIDYPRLEEEVLATKGLLDFQKAGRNIFSIAPGLQQLLNHTAVDTVRWEDITLPYPSLYLHFGATSGIALPRSWYELKFGAMGERWLAGDSYWLDGAFVHAVDHALNITLAFRSQDDDFTQRVALAKDFRFPVVEFQLDFAGTDAAGQGKTVAEATVVYSNLWDPKQGPQEIAYGKLRERLASGDLEEEEEDVHADFRLLDLAAILLINSFCYLNLAEKSVRTAASSPEAAALLGELRAAKNKQKQQPIREKLARLSYSTVRFCGEDISLLAERASGGGEVTAHWRRGHWRRQPVGTGRADVRRVWIKPVIVRGDKGTPEQGHIYEV